MLLKSKFSSDFYNRLAAIYALIGVPVGDENLGAFNETLIPDDQTVKQAIQHLETALDGLLNATDQTGLTIADAGNYFTNDNVEDALQEIGAALQLIQRTKQHFVNTYGDLPTTGNTDGDMAFVNDASADPTVGSGGASYVYGNGGWIKKSEHESMDVALAQPVRGSGAPTGAPAAGASNLYIDTSTTPHTLYHWDGAAWNAFGVGGTNLDVGTRTATVLPVTSSSGNDVDLPGATETEAGIMTADHVKRLDWISQNELT